MTAVNPISYKHHPSPVTLFELPQPLDVTIEADLQAESILSQARLVDFNPAAARRDDPESVRGLTMEQLLLILETGVLEDARDALRLRLKRFVIDGYVLEDISTDWLQDGEKKHYNTSYHGFIENGFLKKILVIHRDESVRRLQERLVTDLAENLAADSSDTFFTSLVYRLAKTLNLDFASVAELVPNSDGVVRMLAFYDGRNKKYEHTEINFSLKGTPGYNVVKGQIQVFRSNVSAQFPEDDYLKSLGIDSYIAVPILAENGQQLGLISLMHSSELPNVELAQSVLSIFAIRACAEIERLRIYQEKNQRELQQKLFIENNPNGMFVVDIDPPMSLNASVQNQVQELADNSRFVECNDSLIKILGCPSKAHLIGKSLFGNVVNYDFTAQARDFINEDFALRDHLIHIVTDDKRDACLSVNLASVIKGDHLTQLLGVVADVSDRIRHSREMEYRAKHDGLTNLPNRCSFIEQAEKMLLASSSSSKHALFMLDLDGFKEVNDTLGHETGDDLLQQIGPRLSPVLSTFNSVLARLGGDEFAVIVEDCDSESSMTNLAEQLMQEIKSPFTVNELELVVGGSVGIAFYPTNSDSVSSLMRCADIAMYQAKQQSRDYCVYSSDSDHYTLRRLSLMMDIRHAVVNDELRLFYQPIIEIESQSVQAFEALIRWQHPTLGMLPPAEFIPLIEMTDMIMPVTSWVIETAVKQLADWKQQGCHYRISVNVSTRNLVDLGFVDYIDNCLQRYNVAGRYLEIEITESTLMADPDHARHVLQSIASLGVYISVDDYGTGYSSLAYLKSLPINTLKIDQTFISQMLISAQDEIIVKSTIQLAHNLGLDVTAEGIDDASLIQTLNELGCDKGQGYYFCKPIPVGDINAWLSLHQRALK
jgi:diguanylate cyclase (GGDEF)-like protein